MTTLARLALALLAALGLLIAGAWALQRRLLYFPAREDEPGARARAAALGLSPWLDEHGALRGWRSGATRAPRARVLVLHGNAGAALDRAYYVAALAPRGLEVALLEYPGYGARPGSPSFDSLGTAAADAALALAREGAPVWLLGESLGSGVAARVVALRPGVVAGVVLVTPFAELTAVARHHYPLLPGSLLRDRWSPLRDLDGFAGPVALLLAGRDEVVTLDEGERLAAALRGPQLVSVQPWAGHNGLDLAPDLPFWDEAVALLARAGAGG
jgi:pimeloyl-ACP methyl ester carboxylesterase